MRVFMRRWAGYCEAFTQRKPRERWLVAIAALAAAVALPYLLWVDPALREGARLAGQIEKQRKTLQSIQADTAALVSAAADPDAASRERVAAAGKRLRALDATMRESQQGLVPPERMPKLLEAMLERSHGLKVVALRTLPATALLDRAGAPEASTGAAGAAGAGNSGAVVAGAGAGNNAGAPGRRPGMVYKHGVELTLEGGYADLVNYLEQMEGLPTRMFWAKAVLDGSAYPRLLLTISVYTLSLEAAWLSV